jgi:aryl-alcohol dehydrogenase-like predicted oxidoreductase
MEHIPLGRTGLKVSRLCLGTMNFGDATNEADSLAIMDKSLELGINVFDTADVYSGGVTEQIVGRWFAKDRNRRKRVVLATKVYNDISSFYRHSNGTRVVLGTKVHNDINRPDQPDPNFGRGLSARKIILACEDSLRRLQTEWIDLYQMHHIDRSCPWEEVWQAMEILVRQGKVLYVGSANFAAWNIAEAQHTAKERHFMGLVSEQSKYSLETRAIELEVLPACRHYGLGVIAWSPLAGGVLAGVTSGQAGVRRHSGPAKKRQERKAAQLSQWEELCRSLGEEPANVALAWLLHQPDLTGPIIGPRTVEQLTGSLRAMEIKLEPDVLKKIDKIWPGPGNQAPEAYAW